MLQAPAIAEPALELRRALDGGALFTVLAEKMSGRAVAADVERINPPSLFAHEADQMDVPYDSNWAALRRTGQLIHPDNGLPVAEVTSVVLLSRLTPGEIRLLQTTDTPLGKVLGAAWGKVLETTLGITEFAVHCRRLIMRGDEAVALTTERVLWSWLCQVDSPDI